MAKWWRVVLLGGIAIVCFDALASIASQRFGFAYSKASFGSDVIYAAIGFFAARATGAIRCGAMAAGTAGVVESTIGWWVSWQIGPGRAPTGPPSAPQLVVIVAFLAAMGAVLGAFGGWASTWRNPARSVAP